MRFLNYQSLIFFICILDKEYLVSEVKCELGSQLSLLIRYMTDQCVRKMSPSCDVIAISIGYLHPQQVLIGPLCLVCYVSNSLSGKRPINIHIKPVPDHFAGKHEVWGMQWQWEHKINISFIQTFHHKVAFTLVMTTLVQISSSSSLLLDISDVVRSVTSLAPDIIGVLTPDLLQCPPGGCGGPVLPPCSGCGCIAGGCSAFIRPPTTSASFQFSSTGSHALAASSALSLAPGVALGIFKGLIIGNNHYTKYSKSLIQITTNNFSSNCRSFEDTSQE